MYRWYDGTSIILYSFYCEGSWIVFDQSNIKQAAFPEISLCFGSLYLGSWDECRQATVE